ncbi:MAG TPA: glycosyltransferase family 2 protein, partial [Candidatus Thermoplasmatota archaeon]|nr:glycosyltransferase family 2 protein [Candidatus Thermoplasmatota archaeon]
KAGALNDALAASREPLVAVLDVDHEPDPDFLVATLPHLAPGVAYAQAVVEWRNDDGLLRRLAATLQRQFYHGVQTDKGSRERAVFAGSAAVFRREALDAVGGFPEETLVEDFDLTLRLACAGWKGRLAPAVGARGLLPWTAGDLARQLWRWSSGTTAVVRRRLVPTLRARGAPLAPRLELLADGCAYLAGGLLVAAAILLVAAGLADVPVARPLGGWSVLLAPGAVAVAHMASGWQALARSGRRGRRLLPLYHVVSLAFTPILFLSSLAALAPGRGRVEGRVAKARSSPRGSTVALALAALLGLAALGAAAFTDLSAAATGWVALMGLSFTATLAAARAPEKQA